MSMRPLPGQTPPFTAGQSGGMGNLFAGFGQKLQGEEGKARLYGVGLLMSQLAQGQAPNAGPALKMLDERRSQRALKEKMGDGKFLDQFSPEERAFLSTLEPRAAQELIAQRIFASPAQPVEVNGQLVNPQTGQVIGDYRTPDAPEPMEVNGQLVDPVTGQVVGDYRTPEQPATTDDIREYEYAQANGYQGSFDQFITEGRRAGATNINLGPDGVDYGDPEKGMAWARNPDNTVKLDERGAPIAVPYQGGSVWREQQDAAGARDAREESQQTSSDVILSAAGNARRIINDNWGTTGTAGAISSVLPSSQAAELRRQTNVLTANATIENLNAMRAQSPTGGALGNVTEGEGKMLAAKAGALDPNASRADFERALDDYERTLLRIVHGKDEGDRLYQQTRSQSQQEAPAGDRSQDIMNMSANDLLGIDTSKLTPEETRAFNSRLDHLGY